jgi:hypothetical protein
MTLVWAEIGHLDRDLTTPHNCYTGKRDNTCEILGISAAWTRADRALRVGPHPGLDRFPGWSNDSSTG